MDRKEKIRMRHENACKEYRNLKEKVIRSCIMELLDLTDEVTNPSSNGYFYQFEYKGLFISFVNQDDRICVDVYDVEPKNYSDTTHPRESFNLEGDPFMSVLKVLDKYSNIEFCPYCEKWVTCPIAQEKER